MSMLLLLLLLLPLLSPPPWSPCSAAIATQRPPYLLRTARFPAVCRPRSYCEARLFIAIPLPFQLMHHRHCHHQHNWLVPSLSFFIIIVVVVSAAAAAVIVVVPLSF
ncbi:hypothetical protein SYNPS1DRAFT_30892 [Syncephalis pseudoplumigaleata]|uniref:Secreted peptide n=1 Tax=Syncephalis pseudoplumigaleata TaxID=1712513 RepID=A0A4V1J104_9FUNG|nr:hypothetical protein SYNPS1DRAFT_30892 [Syncephalis pseudoplumigaleata]|eukprot:RKP23369.1 hypothetical protein SYNPS1DRAFT_30892 [Syncephalis pseudoplumigaleata]